MAQSARHYPHSTMGSWLSSYQASHRSEMLGDQHPQSQHILVDVGAGSRVILWSPVLRFSRTPPAHPGRPARLGWIRQVPVPVLRAGKEKDTHTYDGSSGQTFARMLKIAVADSHGSGNAYASITALCKITPRGVPWKSFTIKRGDTQHCSPSGTHPNARCCRFPGGARRAKPEGRTARV